MQSETQRKKFMHDKVLCLCVPLVESRTKEARLIMEVDNLKSGSILAVLIHFLYVVSFRFPLECYLERETKIEPDLSQVGLITAGNFFFVNNISEDTADPLLGSSSGVPNENIVQNHLNIALLNVF